MTQEPKIFPYIERLLQGAEVVWKPLGEVAEIGTGSSNRQDEDDLGEYPFYVRSKNILRSSSYQFDETAIIIPGEGGIGDIYHYVEGKYALHQRAYRVHLLDENILSKFLFHYMRACFKEYIIFKSVGATATSIRKPMLEKFQIPLPPLSVQQEIVRILDKFTQLEAELEAELDCRKRQYEYYRNKLLSYEGNEVEWKTLGEVAIKIYSGGTPKTGESEYWEKGTIPWMSSGEVNLGTIYQTEKFITEEGLANSSAKFVPVDSLVIALAGQGKTRGKVARIKIKLTTNQSLAALTFDTNKVSSDYVYHYMVTQYEKLRQISSGSGTRGGLNLQMISNFPIPLPPFSEQQRIASILDKFDTLVNSISEGLPKEIALRRKQYEYYREKLLTFTNDK